MEAPVILNILLVLLLSYLAGSIPTSIIIARAVRGIDIRQHGSENAGATNVYRVLGLKWAIIVALADVGKGAFAALVLSGLPVGAPPAFISPVLYQLLAGGAAVAGHIWTLFGGFKGGKGVATAVGAFLGIAPAAVGICLLVWLILVFTVRIMSVASLVAATLLPVAVWVLGMGAAEKAPPELIGFTVLLALLIFYTHRSNIGRLLRGEERVLGRPGSARPEQGGDEMEGGGEG
ncbi:MAG: glycerol-3-phosphate 1-O-acyltransferase PlsY [bacterium]